MFSFSEFIVEEKKDPSSDTAHFFDIDETLFAHDHNKLRVHVNDENGKRIQSLTNQEFNNHKLPKGHSYDFREFKSSDVFGQSAKPIRKMIAKMRAIHKNNKNVEMLTARSDLDDKKKFAHHMAKYGIDIGQIHVRRAGNLNMKPAEAKKLIVSQQIAKNGYKTVHLYDDSHDNLDKFLSLKKHHPDVSFHAHHVYHDHKTGETQITTRRA